MRTLLSVLVGCGLWTSIVLGAPFPDFVDTPVYQELAKEADVTIEIKKQNQSVGKFSFQKKFFKNCDYFNRLLVAPGFKEASSDYIALDTIEISTFKNLINYIFLKRIGPVDFEHLDNLVEAIDMFQVSGMQSQLVSELKEHAQNQDAKNMENLIGLLTHSSQYSFLSELDSIVYASLRSILKASANQLESCARFKRVTDKQTQYFNQIQKTSLAQIIEQECEKSLLKNELISRKINAIQEGKKKLIKYIEKEMKKKVGPRDTAFYVSADKVKKILGSWNEIKIKDSSAGQFERSLTSRYESDSVPLTVINETIEYFKQRGFKLDVSGFPNFTWFELYW